MRKTTLFFHPFVYGSKVSRITFAFEPVFHDDGKLICILASYSLCSLSDQFSRSEGRRIALDKTPTELKVRDIPGFVCDIIRKYSWKNTQVSPSEYYFLCLSFVE